MNCIASEQVKGNDAVCGSALEMMTNGEGDCFTLDAVPFGSAVTISLWARLHSDDASVRCESFLVTDFLIIRHVCTVSPIYMVELDSTIPVGKMTAMPGFGWAG